MEYQVLLNTLKFNSAYWYSELYDEEIGWLAHLFMVRWLIQLIFATDFPAVNILLDLRNQRLHERLVTANQGDGVLLLPPARIAAHLDAVRIRPSSEVGQIWRHRTLRERRAEKKAVDTLTLRVRQPRQQTRLEILKQSLKQTRHAGEDVDVTIDHCNRHPHVIRDEDGLLLVRQARVVRKFDHAQLGRESRRWGVPVEMGLHWMRPRECLHALEGWLMQFQFQTEGLGYRFIGDVVVA